jgi:hypothetical protein
LNIKQLAEIIDLCQVKRKNMKENAENVWRNERKCRTFATSKGNKRFPTAKKG